jgi:hypothetical protein
MNTLTAQEKAQLQQFRPVDRIQMGEDANSGVFVRSPQESGGYDVQIWKQQPAGYNTGAIVGTAKTARDYRFNPDQWNHYQITAERDHIVVVLNGETTLDIHDERFSEGNLRFSTNNSPSPSGTSKSVRFPEVLALRDQVAPPTPPTSDAVKSAESFSDGRKGRP